MKSNILGTKMTIALLLGLAVTFFGSSAHALNGDPICNLRHQNGGSTVTVTEHFAAILIETANADGSFYSQNFVFPIVSSDSAEYVNNLLFKFVSQYQIQNGTYYILRPKRSVYLQIEVTMGQIASQGITIGTAAKQKTLLPYKKNVEDKTFGDLTCSL